MKWRVGIPDEAATKRFPYLGLILLWSLVVGGQENAATIVQRATEANRRDWAAAPEFENYERDRNKDGDKTYAVTMLYGSPYERLIAVNGHPLSKPKQEEEEKKYEETVDGRRGESAAARSRRIARYEAERKRDHTLVEQLSTAFDFTLAGDQTLNGYQVYVVKATPHRGYRPPNRDSAVLTGMKGTLWIDRSTYQWVKVEAHVTRPVAIVGFVAQVEPGTQFELEKRPVSGDIWLATHFSMKSKARVMLFILRRGQEDDTFFNYHKATDAAIEAKSASEKSQMTKSPATTDGVSH